MKRGIIAFAALLLGLLLIALPATGGRNLAELLKSHLKAGYPWAEIEVSDIETSSQVPAAEPERIALERGPLGKAVFGLFYADGRKISVTATVKAFDWVLMSRRALPKGRSLAQDDTYATLMDVTRLPKGGVGPGIHLKGKSMLRAVAANMPLTEGMLSDALLVKKGQQVMLVAESEGLSITTKAEMKETASVGSFVKVINLSSRKVLTGLLLDDRTVRVEF
jgi:flagella basal body P-ring formation protein FlgA